MSDYTNANAGFTPSTTQDNWVLDTSTNAVLARIKYVTWGGSGTTSTGYRTRWYRPTTIGSGTFTAIGAISTVGASTSGALLRFGSFATACTPPADPSALLNQAWNVLGGGGIMVLPIGSEWIVMSVGTVGIQGQVACRNVAGIDNSLSSYSVQWNE